jgi:hypothetical protein
MSSAAVEQVVEQRPKLDLVPAKPAPAVHETEQWDPHPLILSLTFIGSILAWLALRHSGVMAL